MESEHSMSNGKQRHISQSITLTGFDSPAFQTCVDNLQSLQQLLSRQIPDGTMEPFTLSHLSSYDSITFSTRYFTSRREDPFGTEIQFPHVVDPKGILASMSTDNYFHGADNEVRYYSMTLGKEPPL